MSRKMLCQTVVNVLIFIWTHSIIFFFFFLQANTQPRGRSPWLWTTEVSLHWNWTAERSTPRTPFWKRTGPGEHLLLLWCERKQMSGLDPVITDSLSECVSRSPPRPSPGGLHYSDDDICNNYNGAVLTESTTLTEKPTEVSESEVSCSVCLHSSGSRLKTARTHQESLTSYWLSLYNYCKSYC